MVFSAVRRSSPLAALRSEIKEEPKAGDIRVAKQPAGLVLESGGCRFEDFAQALLGAYGDWQALLAYFGALAARGAEIRSPRARTRSSTPDWPVGQSFRISRASFACSLRPKKCPAMRGRFLAEAVRFELTNPFELTVFKTVAIDHSATLPVGLDYTSIDALGTYAGQGISPHL